MAKLRLSTAMLIFGSIGVFTRMIPLPSGVLAMVRGSIGALFLLVLSVLLGHRLSWTAIRRNLWLLITSGAEIGVNWIFLFEAYRYTTVAIAILCYYMAPVFVILLSPLILKERLTGRRMLCLLAALVGMLLVSGVLQGELPDAVGRRGIIMGLLAACFYATAVFINKFQRDIPVYDTTIMQLAIAALVVLPYNLLTQHVDPSILTPKVILLVLVVGIVHTGVAYALYFSGLQKLNSQIAAILSYVDPAFAILLSVFLLREAMDPAGLLGAVLILGSTMISELNFGRKKREAQAPAVQDEE